MKPIRYTPSLIDRYYKSGLWGDIPTILDRIEMHASARPDKEAVVDASRRLTWVGVKRWTDRVALGLIELGLERDSVILAQLPNLVQTWLLRFAFQKAGMLGLTTPMRFGFRELGHLLRETKAKALVVAPAYMDATYFEHLDRIRKTTPSLTYLLTVNDAGPEGSILIDTMAETPLEENYPRDYLKSTAIRRLEVEALISTSATTGLPKAIENVSLPISVQEAFIKAWHLTPDDVMAALIPLYGGAAALSWNTVPWLGSKVVMLEKFESEEALRLIERERITVANVIPTQMVKMINHPRLSRYDLSSLRYFVYSGAPCLPVVAERVEEVTGAIVLGIYGATETAALTIGSPDDPPQKRYASIGKPRPGVEIRLLNEQDTEVAPGEVGEIVARGATCPSGYFQDAEATLTAWGGELDGWYRTGDLARRDEEGYLYLMGRKKELIIRGGQNIVPSEIENLLCSHPAVAQAAVVPMPDLELGERACAYVSLRAGMTFTFEEMVRYLKEQGLAVFKLPERLEVMAELPETGGQKIAKQELVQDIMQKLKHEGRADAG